jgi:hypothetical protein
MGGAGASRVPFMWGEPVMAGGTPSHYKHTPFIGFCVRHFVPRQRKKPRRLGGQGLRSLRSWIGCVWVGRRRGGRLSNCPFQHEVKPIVPAWCSSTTKSGPRGDLSGVWQLPHRSSGRGASVSFMLKMILSCY